jgi:Ca2+-binding EF-hand superfamily protein
LGAELKIVETPREADMTLVDTGADTYAERMSALFSSFDQDGDGLVAAADVEARATRVLEECGAHPRSPKGRALVRGAQRYFGGFASLADEDGDGVISRDEFVTAAAQRLRHNPDGFEAVVRPWIAALLDLADEGGDGAVDCTLWIRVLRAAGAGAEEATESAVRIDTDGDGRIGADQVLDAAQAFYTDTAPAGMREADRYRAPGWQVF